MASIRTIIQNDLTTDGVTGLIQWLSYVMSYETAGVTKYRIFDSANNPVTDINTFISNLHTTTLRVINNVTNSKENLTVCLCDYKFIVEPRCFTSALSDYIPSSNTNRENILNIMLKINRSDTDRSLMHVRDIVLTDSGPHNLPSVLVP